MAAIAASMSLQGSLEGKELFPIDIKIGTPYEVDEDDWACSVSVNPLFGRLGDQHGVDSFQALFLAMKLALSLLKGFTEKGGSLFMKGGEETSFAWHEGFPFEAFTIGHNMEHLPLERRL